jgi:DNA-binding transcriptional ArsR family regulator
VGILLAFRRLAQEPLRSASVQSPSLRRLFDEDRSNAVLTCGNAALTEFPFMVSTTTVAQIGSILGDPARASMMIALLDGRAWTARELAGLAGVSPQTASSHLAKLIDSRMVLVERRGRHHYHTIASADIARLMEQMHVVGVALPRSKATSSGPRDAGMRELRSCYDHLAGRIAVELSERLIECDHEQGVRFKHDTESRLSRIGIDLSTLAQGRRTICRTCLDWSERKPHIAGSLGAAMLERLLELGWVKRQLSGRALDLTATGKAGITDVFGVCAGNSGT